MPHPSPSAHACTSSAPGVSQAFKYSGHDGLGVCIRNLPKTICKAVIPGLLLAMPCSPEALAVPHVHALHQSVQVSTTGPSPVGVGAQSFSQKPSTDWLSRLVEFFSPIPPQCRVVTSQQAKKECEQRDKGTLEQFKHEHPVLFNLVVAAATFLLGFYLTGGFSRGGK